jgi:hypothetical protein
VDELTNQLIFSLSLPEESLKNPEKVGRIHEKCNQYGFTVLYEV